MPSVSHKENAMIPGNYFLIGLAALAVVIMINELRHKVLVGKLESGTADNLNCWKWGIFYFNPGDSRIFVPKRIASLGWTLNFARPGSLLLLAGILLFVVLIRML